MADNSNNKPNKEGGEKPQGSRFNFYWIYAGIGVFLLILFGSSLFQNKSATTSRQGFEKMIDRGDVEKVEIQDNALALIYLKQDALEDKNSDGEPVYEEVQSTNRLGLTNQGPHYQFTISTNEDFNETMQRIYEDNEIPADKEIEVVYTKSVNWGGMLGWILPLIIIVFIWIFLMRRMTGGMGGAGGQIFNIGKSKATLFDRDTKIQVTFNDVAGLDEAKVEVMEIVDFLKNPQKYTALGGKIPKGALLIGPPGTGKTLLAKAMAGEAQVPFFTISGSDFVEMFVGVGASRVRDLFKQAREKAPCIIFIDEIDAIGRARGKSLVQGNDERENTLNQLLVEMDGFSSEKGVIMIAATNRPDVLDSALLRPGRFDRQISIDKPDLKGREQIFKVHLKPIKVSDTVSPAKLAAQTPGFVGADIANICNEAALIAARRNKKEVEMQDFQDAVDRVIGGLEKKNKIISPDEKEIIAYHEAGHAIAGWFLEHAHPLVKVSIVPRGVAALGYAQYLPKEKYIERTEEILDRMCMSLGGRAAEKVVFGKISTGAQSDLDHVTKMAYSMVVVFGMNEQVGNVSYYDMLQQNTFNKPYSDETAKLIDDEMRKLIDGQYERAQQLLVEKRHELDLLAKRLLEKEVLFKDDLTELLGERPFEQTPENGHVDDDHKGKMLVDKADKKEESTDSEVEQDVEKPDTSTSENS